MTHALLIEKPHLTATEYAELQGVDPSTITRRIVAGRIRAEKLGKEWVIPRAEIERLAGARAAAVDTEQAATYLATQWRLVCGKAVDRLLATAREIPRNTSLLRFALDASEGEVTKNLTPKAVELLRAHLDAAADLRRMLDFSSVMVEVVGDAARKRRNASEGMVNG